MVTFKGVVQVMIVVMVVVVMMTVVKGTLMVVQTFVLLSLVSRGMPAFHVSLHLASIGKPSFIHLNIICPTIF